MATGSGTSSPSSQTNDGCSQALTGCSTTFVAWFTLVLLVIGGVWNITQLQHLKRQVEKEADAEWQEGTVYSIVAEAKTGGGTIDDLYDSYRDAAEKAVEKQRVTERVLSKNAFKQVLISLSSKRVIIAIGTDKYRILGLSDLCGCGHATNELIDQLMPLALNFLSTPQANGTLTQEQVISAIQGIGPKPIEQGEAQVVFDALWERFWSELIYKLARSGISERTARRLRPAIPGTIPSCDRLEILPNRPLARQSSHPLAVAHLRHPTRILPRDRRQAMTSRRPEGDLRENRRHRQRLRASQHSNA